MGQNFSFCCGARPGQEDDVPKFILASDTDVAKASSLTSPVTAAPWLVMQAAAGKGAERMITRLFVDNLPRDIAPETLASVFSTYGPLEDVHIMTGKAKNGKSCAFVLYFNPQDAASAFVAMQAGYEICPGEGDLIVNLAGSNEPQSYERGRHAYQDKGEGWGKASYADKGKGLSKYHDFNGRSSGSGFGAGGDAGVNNGSDSTGNKLYVGNLPHDITRDAVEMVFSRFGRVEDVHIMSGTSNSDNVCAFVLYADPQNAKTAIAAMQSGYEILAGEEDIIVKFADSGKCKKGQLPDLAGDGGAMVGSASGSGKGAEGMITRLFVDNLPRDIAQETLASAFSTYGPLEDVHIMTGKAKHCKSCAFVLYFNPQDAASAFLAMQAGYEICPGEGDLIVNLAGSKEHQSYERGRNAYEDKGEGWGKDSYADKGKGLSKYHDFYGRSSGSGFGAGGDAGGNGFDSTGNRLYVGNLPLGITRDAVETEFSTFGRLEDVHIMSGTSNSDNPCAFVWYADPFDAETAIAAMQSGYEIRPGEGKMTVKFADSGKYKKGGQDHWNGSSVHTWRQ